MTAEQVERLLAHSLVFTEIPSLEMVSNTSSVTATNYWFRHSLHLIFGFSQMPGTYSLRHAGA
jgi:hypothetical protein